MDRKKRQTGPVAKNTNLELMIKALPLLKPAERKELHSRIHLLEEDKTAPSELDQELFHDTITKVLKKKLQKDYPPLYVFRTQKGYKKFKEALAETLDFMNSALKGKKLNRSDKQKFYLLSTHAILYDMQGSPIPISLTTVLQSFLNLPGILDKQAPGLLGTGLFFKQKLMNKKELEDE